MPLLRWRPTAGPAAIAKLPLAKDLTDIEFKGAPINQALVRDLATGGFTRRRQCRASRRKRAPKTHLASLSLDLASAAAPAAASTT